MTDRIHLVVATPCLGGQVSSIYASSIFHLQRAVRSGGEIWADLESRLDHVGPSVFHGDISSQFATHASAADAA
jgi:hypothetical protein